MHALKCPIYSNIIGSSYRSLTRQRGHAQGGGGGQSEKEPSQTKKHALLNSRTTVFKQFLLVLTLSSSSFDVGTVQFCPSPVAHSTVVWYAVAMIVRRCLPCRCVEMSCSGCRVQTYVCSNKLWSVKLSQRSMAYDTIVFVRSEPHTLILMPQMHLPWGEFKTGKSLRPSGFTGDTNVPVDRNSGFESRWRHITMLASSVADRARALS